MKTLKIGFVLDDSLDKTDGVQQYVLGLGEWMSQQGHEVHYLVGATKRTDLQNIHSLSRNVRVRFNGNRMSMPLPARRSVLRNLLKNEQFDVLHVQVPYSPWLAHRIIRLASKKTAIIGTFHIMPQSGIVRVANRLLAWWLHRSLKRFDKAFAVSEPAEQFARDVYGLACDVLPNVVDVAKFKSAKPLTQYDDDKITIMFLGRLVPRKGCMTLLEAATILKQRKNLPPFRVLICGKGELEDELKSYAADHLLDELVTFTGFVPEDEKARYFASADIMAFPSTGGESFGIVLIEGMATGRSVVLAGDNPGYRSVLHARPELLFEPGNAFALANVLTMYLRNPADRKAVLAWQHHFVGQFDVAVVGTWLVTNYRDCCSKHTK